MSVDKEKVAIIKYSLELGKRTITYASIRTVDYIAELFINKLLKLDAEQEAQELYDFYISSN